MGCRIRRRVRFGPCYTIALTYASLAKLSITLGGHHYDLELLQNQGIQAWTYSVIGGESDGAAFAKTPRMVHAGAKFENEIRMTEHVSYVTF